MTDREIERVLQEGRRAIAEKRNAELRARVAAKLMLRRRADALLRSAREEEESADVRKIREYALIS